jgi:hypothetical protein
MMDRVADAIGWTDAQTPEDLYVKQQERNAQIIKEFKETPYT